MIAVLPLGQEVADSKLEAAIEVEVESAQILAKNPQ